MTHLSKPFDPDKNIPPDWTLDTKNYPNVFLVDQNWTNAQDYSFLPGTKFKALSPDLVPLDDSTDYCVHGEQTRWVVQHIAREVPNNQITLVSVERELPPTLKGILPPKNLSTALTGVKNRIRPGDLVVINVGPNHAGNSFVCDSLIGSDLSGITDNLQGIVVISAGNDKETRLSASLTPNAVVVGAVDTDGTSKSRYGPNVTCYGVTPYDLADYPVSVPFENSSAATAYTAGMVLMMLNYATSTGRILTGKQVIDTLKASSQSFNVLSASNEVLDTGGLLPQWDNLRTAIDALP